MSLPYAYKATTSCKKLDKSQERILRSSSDGRTDGRKQIHRSHFCLRRGTKNRLYYLSWKTISLNDILTPMGYLKNGLVVGAAVEILRRNFAFFKPVPVYFHKKSDHRVGWLHIYRFRETNFGNFNILRLGQKNEFNNRSLKYTFLYKNQLSEAQ